MPDALSYAVPANAIRMFIGFRRADLPVDRFLRDVGQTFMPGTPYMLQPLGLAAYLPAVIQETAGSPCPHEVALIAWPSPEAQRQATRNTLRGRVYTQGHAGVYDPRSHATFPVAIGEFDTASPGSFYLLDGNTDWQLGSYSLFVGIKQQGQMSGRDFREAMRRRIAEVIPSLSAGGVDQVIAAAEDDFIVIWTHHGSDAAQPGETWGSLEDLVSPSASMVGTRVICRDEPPAVELSGSMALNFIFLRNASLFLR